MTSPTRPLPQPDFDTAPYFEHAARGVLAVPRCDDCQSVHWYPAPRCPHCGSPRLAWQQLCGDGTIYSFTIVHHAVRAAPALSPPYVIGLIEVPDAPGIRLIGNVVNVPSDDVRIGMAVSATFEVVAAGMGLVHFEPATGRMKAD